MSRRLLSFLFCFYFLLLAIPSAAAKHAFTIEDLYHIRGIDDLHVSRRRQDRPVYSGDERPGEGEEASPTSG